MTPEQRWVMVRLTLVMAALDLLAGVVSGSVVTTAYGALLATFTFYWRATSETTHPATPAPIGGWSR